MHSKHLVGIATAVLLLSSVAWLVGAGPAPAAPKAWEYKIVSPPVNLDNFEKGPHGLDELGSHGWELVSVTTPNKKDWRYFCILKRQK